MTLPTEPDPTQKPTRAQADEPPAPGYVQVPMEGSRLLGKRYRLDERIGAGGMGVVWRGTDLMLARQVAIKLLRPEYAQQDGLDRFRAEARHAGSVSHPGIAQVYDYSEDDPTGQPYLVMELVNGPSLAWLLNEGPLEPALTMRIIGQAARGLQAAHATGLMHRDIKPGNLLISPGWQVKITDFGIARLEGSAQLTRTGAMICTPAYLAPERAAGAPATPASDLYSLGIVAFECLTGKPPFTGEPIAVALAHQERRLPPLPQGVPPQVAAFIADLTAKDPQARPGAAAPVAARAEQLSAVLGGADGGSRPRVPTGAPPPTGAEGGGNTRPDDDRPAKGGGPAGPPRRRLAGLPARAAVVVAALAMLGLGGLAIAEFIPDAAPAPVTPPAAGQPSASARASATPDRSPGPRFVSAHHGRKGGHGKHGRHGHPSKSPAPSPTPPSTSPLPSPSPTPSTTSPSPSPTPSNPTPTPTDTATTP
jgi:serine/threonine-protein kinase